MAPAQRGGREVVNRGHRRHQVVVIDRQWGGHDVTLNPLARRSIGFRAFNDRRVGIDAVSSAICLLRRCASRRSPAPGWAMDVPGRIDVHRRYCHGIAGRFSA